MKRFLFVTTGIVVGSFFGPVGVIVGGVGGFVFGGATPTCRRCELIAKGQALVPTVHKLRSEAERQVAAYRAANMVSRLVMSDGSAEWRKHNEVFERGKSYYLEAFNMKACPACQNFRNEE